MNTSAIDSIQVARDTAFNVDSTQSVLDKTSDLGATHVPLDIITIVSLIIIVVAMIGFAIYILYQKQHHHLNRQRQWIEQMPTIVSTLGVLGTFFGVTKGLYHFDPQDLDASIPALLDGLKTAFVTSLAGMIGSLILTRIVNRCFDEVDSEELEQDKQLRLITALTAIQNYLSGDENKRFRNGLVSSTEGMNSSIRKLNETMEGLVSNIQQIRDDVEEIKGHVEEIKGAMGGESADTEQIRRLIGVATTATESISRMDVTLSEVRDITDKMGTSVGEFADELDEIRENTQRD